MQYSPLWLDPSSLPPEHEYYQASYVRENERGQEDALALLAYAFAQGEERGEDEEGEGDKASSAASSAAGHFADEAARSDDARVSLSPDDDAPRAGLGRSKAADAERASPPPPPPQVSPAAQRRLDAARFCTLPAATRLALTHAHLRTTYAYCVYCGHRYATYNELLAVCPGEAEDAHE